MTPERNSRTPASRDGTKLNRRNLLQGSIVAPVVAGAAVLQEAGATAAHQGNRGTPVADGFFEPESTMFATAFIESAGSLHTESDGDLWPSTWADDGNLYLMNGDGRGFDLTAPFADIVMNRLVGTPETGLTGTRLAAGDEIAPIWGDPASYNRKPTGIVAVDGDGDGRDELYAAIQDLRHGVGGFDDAPNASIAVSRDYGLTWESTDRPMFTDHIFTTIFFLDYGKSNRGAAVLGADGASYVYAYGIDFNWRDSFSDLVTDPTDLYLARVPAGSIQMRGTWEFFAGLHGEHPVWTANEADRQPVLTDTRRVYPTLQGTGIRDMTVISQGCVVYNQPLDRYLYTSWTEYTFEFYEAPQPWGPWTLFLRKDFGAYPWFGSGAEETCPTPKNGGYATTISSKFISSDGRSMWVQANWFVGVGCGLPNYHYSLRKLTVEPFVPSLPGNRPDRQANLAITGAGVTPIEKSTHFGQAQVANDGRRDRSEDSFDQEDKTVDFWGYTWSQAYSTNRVVYTTGNISPNGGWFSDRLRVQVRRDFEWNDVQGQKLTPRYAFDETVEPFQSFTITFDESWGDGVRIIGTPGGRSHFTSISELEVYFDPPSGTQ